MEWLPVYCFRVAEPWRAAAVRREPLINSGMIELWYKIAQFKAQIARNAPGRLLSRKRDSSCSQLLRRFATQIMSDFAPQDAMSRIDQRFQVFVRDCSLQGQGGEKENEKTAGDTLVGRDGCFGWLY